MVSRRLYLRQLWRAGVAANVEARQIDFRVLAAEPRRIEIERLGNELMEAVGRVVPALPVSLVSTAILEAADQPLSLFEIKARVATLIGEIEQLGSYVHIPRADRDYANAIVHLFKDRGELS